MTHTETEIQFTGTGTTANDSIEDFSYTVSDGNGNQAEGTATIRVTDVDPPFASNFSLQATQGVPLVVSLTEGNDPQLFDYGDVEGDLSLVDFSVDSRSVQGANISRVLNEITYATPAGFVGLDSFQYSVNDGNGNNAVGFITITISQARRTEKTNSFWDSDGSDELLDLLASDSSLR